MERMTGTVRRDRRRPVERPQPAARLAPMVVTVIVVAVAVMPTGCAAPAEQPSKGGNARCSVQAHQPHESHGSPGNIAAKVDIRCRPRVDSLTVVAKLQRRRGDTWVDVAESDPRKVARPKSGQKVTVTVAMQCRAGTFRTVGRGSGYLDGVRSESRTWTYSRPVTDPCD